MTGIDRCGERWAKANGIPVKPFEADWKDLSKPDAIIKYRKDGTAYDAKEGHRRNTRMLCYADAAICIRHEPISKGTRDMLKQVKDAKMPYAELICDQPPSA